MLSYRHSFYLRPERENPKLIKANKEPDQLKYLSASMILKETNNNIDEHSRLDGMLQNFPFYIFKWVIAIILGFNFVFSTVNRKQMLSIKLLSAGCEVRYSGFGRECCANCATTIAFFTFCSLYLRSSNYIVEARY